MNISKRNPLLATDVYKMGHMEQYVPGTNKVYAYLCARYPARVRGGEGASEFDKTVFFGLQYYIKNYLSVKLTPAMGEEFLKYRSRILGSNSPEVSEKIKALCELGYFPIEIKAVAEGSVMPVKNALMTITNTIPEFYWVPGFLESLLLKLWYPTTVASCCFRYRQVVEEAFESTCSQNLDFLKDFMVHDFGYRGDTTEEGAALSGAAHLISFKGSDTVPALPFTEEFYNADSSSTLIMASVPASEHSVMCSFGREDELGAFRNMLRLYPTGIVSIVSDTFDVYKVLTEFAAELKDQILAREGKVVFRPDSGNPEDIICGAQVIDFEYIVNDLNGFDNALILGYKYVRVPGTNSVYKINPAGSSVPFDQTVECTNAPEVRGAIRLLDDMFGSTYNDKGFKELNPKVGLIYGDGMYLERYQRTLNRMKEMGYAATNLVIGVGGILRNHSRDTLGFAIKATYVEVNGQPREIEKDPVTDRSKKSHKGLMSLYRDDDGIGYITADQVAPWAEQNGLLKTVFKNGLLTRETSLAEVQKVMTDHLHQKHMARL